MRKFIIDTDTGSDDAYAIMMALECEDADVLGITTVSGNVPLDKATNNALMTVEVCKKKTPVYRGAAKPLFRSAITAQGVHGSDGMGDMNLIHPSLTAESKHAADYMLETLRDCPENSIELIMLGPATTVALAILKDAKTMSRLKRVYSMGTAGFGPGNVSPVAEFNVFADAESYGVLLNSGLPLTIIGFDLCRGEAALNSREIDRLLSMGEKQRFFGSCVQRLKNHNVEIGEGCVADLPDAVAMGIALWDDVSDGFAPSYCYCCTREEPAYGQVIIHRLDSGLYRGKEKNADVATGINAVLFKKRLMELLEK
jgi:purine nucleosidase